MYSKADAAMGNVKKISENIIYDNFLSISENPSRISISTWGLCFHPPYIPKWILWSVTSTNQYTRNVVHHCWSSSFLHLATMQFPSSLILYSDSFLQHLECHICVFSRATHLIRVTAYVYLKDPKSFSFFYWAILQRVNNASHNCMIIFYDVGERIL